MEKKDKAATAWMIKNDGTEIPVVTHWYADKNEIDEVLALAYHLWVHDEGSRDGVLRGFFDLWMLRTFREKMRYGAMKKDKVNEAIKNYVSSRPYFIFPKEFADTITADWFFSERRFSASRIAKFNEMLDERWIGGRELVDTLNQKFLRARYGGKKNTEPGNKDMYFRISSVGFDWFPLIRSFAEKRADTIESVTIMRDAESTGSEAFYRDDAGSAYDKMPLKEFFAGQSSTNLLSRSESGAHIQIQKILADGGSAKELGELDMDRGTLEGILSIIHQLEEERLSRGA